MPLIEAEEFEMRQLGHGDPLAERAPRLGGAPSGDDLN